jgi:hypothetical protein
MGEDRGVFDAVEVAANLFGGVDAMVEVRDETGDRTLEVNIVLPEGVVGVYEQGLTGGAPVRLIEGDHRLIIKRFYPPGLPRWRERCHAWGMSVPVGVCQIVKKWLSATLHDWM